MADKLSALKSPLLGSPQWLSEGRAFDIPLRGETETALREARAVTQGIAADLNVVPLAGRRKKLLVSDMESTIISCECLDELAEIAGIKPKIADITERAMRGEIAFEGALRERVGLLKGLPLAALEQVYREKAKLIPGAKEFVATMKKHGAHTMLVSGGFTYYTAKIAELIGFDEHQANSLHIESDKLAGTVGEPILGREAKLEALERGLKKFGLKASDALAIGDGANDLAMIQKAGMGVAFHAKPVVAAAADFAISHGDLRDVLYLQGYSDREIVGE